MKLPSVKILLENALQTVRRFPLSLLSAATMTSAILYLIEGEGRLTSHKVENLAFVAALGIALFFVITILVEKRHWSLAHSLLVQGAGVLVLAGYYFALPSAGLESAEMHMIRFLLFVIALHSFVAFAPYWGKGELNGFWQYNKNLLLRLLTAGLYSATLFVGLAIAVLAVDKLFELNFKDERYGQLFVLIAGVFNTWFFLAGAPKGYAALERDDDYPRGLKVFTQYVLLPLVVIYLAILYAYETKIIIAWSWPKGWVANLVLFFSVVGILALLLLHPIQRLSENKWVSRFAQWYYVALIPLVIMLLLAIQVRIADYGITESRYFVLVMGLALAVVVLYFIFSREKNIKIIPILLCGLALFSSCGAWGAFAVSRKSQTQRFERLLSKNNLLRNGVIIKAAQAAPKEDAEQIFSIMRYLQQRHGVAALRSFFKQNLDSLITSTDSSKTVSSRDLPRLALGLMGLSLDGHEASGHWSLVAQREAVLPIAGYETLLRLQSLNAADSMQSFVHEAMRYTIFLEKDRSRLVLTAQETWTDTLRFELGPWLEERLRERQWEHGKELLLPREKLVFEQAAPHLEVKLGFNSMNGESVAGKLKLISVDAEVLIRRR